jgi:hypothetical protein
LQCGTPTGRATITYLTKQADEAFQPDSKPRQWSRSSPVAGYSMKSELQKLPWLTNEHGNLCTKEGLQTDFAISWSNIMHGIIYLIGLIVVVMAVLSLLGLR